MKNKFGILSYSYEELLEIPSVFERSLANWGIQINKPRDLKKLSILQKELVYFEADKIVSEQGSVV